MATRLTRIYIRFLLALGSALLAASLLLHLRVFLGAKSGFPFFGPILFAGAIAFAGAAFPFVKNKQSWVPQIKTCPEWMWRGSLMLGVYALGLTVLLIIFSLGSGEPNPAIPLSGVPLAMESISISILYSLLSPNYMSESELPRRALYSVIGMIAGAIIVAGFLRNASF